MEKVNDVGKGSWGRVGLGYLLIMTLLVLLGGLLSLFMRCSIQGADKRLPLPGDPPRLAKKRHPPCRFASPQRKCLAAFLALPPLHCL
ncbi:hypothetical protein [Pseudomonas syringae]|uniref:ATPase component n=1 Tax=Pseudomonas syringae pv. actinidiae TaxID=103796 RepID=A0A2V0QER8_PSESF|nr:hypothetical protein [Pseudomonas syringae]MDG6384622.1 hypothetical protein [Pseudomonas syringae]MDU8488621.1 hypothetical protein [Pseudomonas syringae pv. actinidiae]NVL38197.1 hypothetical protein [Pseudomonas syringae pv. actinidiae]NVL59860.1 hypothetical protein [Pseudomonas syringae pv. actinidiae]RMS56685.1 hypothetical protein ALP64_201535 [Pseudomonas syringae pv. actinidiae]